MKEETRAQLKDEAKLELRAIKFATIAVNGTAALSVTLICVAAFMFATPLGLISVALLVPAMLLFWLSVAVRNAKHKMEVLKRIESKLGGGGRGKESFFIPPRWFGLCPQPEGKKLFSQKSQQRDKQP